MNHKELQRVVESLTKVIFPVVHLKKGVGVVGSQQGGNTREEKQRTKEERN